MSKYTHNTVTELVEQEREQEETWNDLDGCRRGHHAFNDDDDALYQRTGGLQSWMTHDNFIISLTENKNRETPTEVIIGLITMLLSSRTLIAYTERIAGIGYDMMCNLYARARTLITNSLLEPLHSSLIIKFLQHLFIDKWHVKPHKNALCQNDEGGLFHPYLPKFKNILYGNVKTNDQVVEQNWKIINKLKFAKNMRARKFKFLLYDFRKRHNKKNWKRLLQKGYSFVPISNVSTIRNLENIETTLPTTEQLISSSNTTLEFPKLIK